LRSCQFDQDRRGEFAFGELVTVRRLAAPERDAECQIARLRTGAAQDQIAETRQACQRFAARAAGAAEAREFAEAACGQGSQRRGAELAADDDPAALEILADTALCLARGEALQWRQQHDPDTSVDAYLERCALKTGKLFEAACLLGGRDARLGTFGLRLGIAFQIVDDILDCSGSTIETGKVAGTDLRDGTPTLPLLLAARKDAVVRAALAGGPLNGALIRVAATGALERSRDVALDYARSARAALDGAPCREELDALTEAVVNRTK
jgi:geranylgeranyl pyrophosphate synthase